MRRDDDSAEDSDADTTPLGVDIHSIHLLAKQDDVEPGPEAGASKIVVADGLEVPPRLVGDLERHLGEAMTMSLLESITSEVVAAWRESDHPLVDVYYPEQNITGGKLQIIVREAVLGEKGVTGAEVSREDYLLRHLRVDRGGRINQRVVEEDLDWLNENPIREVNVVFERGEADGTSDIVLEVVEEKPFRVYTGFANSGVDLTGEEEWSFGFTWMNPGREEHLFGYHFASDLEFDNLLAHSIYYRAFLPWRHSFRVFAAHVTSESDIALPVAVAGVSKQLTAEYHIPLQRPSFHRRWRHGFDFAFDYKSTNSDLLFGGLTFFGNEIEIGQFRAVYDATVSDDAGVTRLSAGLIASPGGMFDHNDDASFALARAGSDAEYAYGIAEVERLGQLPGGFSYRFDLRGQATSERLASTEQMLAGGYLTVRGFDESIVRGDSGLLSTLELIGPDFSLCPDCDDTWNAFVFHDAAALDISDALPGEVGPSLQSIGLGLNCRFGDRGFARAAYGWAVQSHGLPVHDEPGGKFHFGLTLTY